MAKSKITQKGTKTQEPAEFMNHIRTEVKKLEGCNFEEFKANMIAVIEQMYQVMLMTVELSGLSLNTTHKKPLECHTRG